jgi:truncated hemoglobin YjbI
LNKGVLGRFSFLRWPAHYSVGMSESDTSSQPDPQTAYEWLGGDARVRALVDRFYDLMDLEPGYTELRQAHGPSLNDARDKLYWFLSGWLGGPAITSNASVTHACAPATCPSPLASRSATSGWPA